MTHIYIEQDLINHHVFLSEDEYACWDMVFMGFLPPNDDVD